MLSACLGNGADMLDTGDADFTYVIVASAALFEELAWAVPGGLEQGLLAGRGAAAAVAILEQALAAIPLEVWLAVIGVQGHALH